MKEIDELNFPEGILYANDHEWAEARDGHTRIGISDYAQDQLGDVVFVELPQVGDVFEKGERFGTVESVKAVSELYIPVGGKIVSTNASLEDSPDMVNKDPYKEGWMIEVRLSDSGELRSLMSREAYIAFLKGKA